MEDHSRAQDLKYSNLTQYHKEPNPERMFYIVDLYECLEDLHGYMYMNANKQLHAIQYKSFLLGTPMIGIVELAQSVCFPFKS